jgi:phospholipid/cholesterol/gamma-HCH transport system substrate-binding protein
VRRVAAITAVLAAAAGIAIFGTGAGDSSGYQVRAIFDDAAFVIPGEDVKIAGVKVGKISSLDVTKDKKAAIVLDITSSGFQDFRTDAHCTVRPQSLIGERYIECTPTAPHPPGTKPPPKLSVIEKGTGKGQHYLPVKNTSSPVDIDEINNILRQPNSQRLALIINEFGTGLAGNGKNLAETIRRANPALQATDEVLNILANQNKVLADLARDSDTVIAPLSAQRQHVADFVDKANTVNEATAERSAALRANLQLLPRFLQELRPTMVRLGSLSDETTPVVQDLRSQAPAINRLIIQLGPFAQASRPAFRSLGQAADVGIPATKAFNPIVTQVDQFSRAAKPVAQNLSAILTSLRDTGGVERVMDYAFFQVAAINGFDSISHYLRAALIVNLCSSYSVSPVTGCSANFAKDSGTGTPATAARAGKKASPVAKEQAVAAAGGDPVLERTAKVLAGEKPDQVYADEARAKVEARQAREARARRAAALRRAKRTKAHAARAKAAERRAVLRARRLCHRTDSPQSKERCARARRHTRALAKARAKAERDRTSAQKDTPISLPNVQLPGGLGAATPPPQTPQPAPTPADSPTATAPGPTSAGATPADQPPAQQAEQPPTADPKQGLFDYLLGN